MHRERATWSSVTSTVLLLYAMPCALTFMPMTGSVQQCITSTLLAITSSGVLLLYYQVCMATDSVSMDRWYARHLVLLIHHYMVYWTPISNPLTLWERGYVGVPGISLSLYLCSLLLIRMHTMYDVYNATPACIIYSYYCPCSVCTYVHPCLAPAPLLLCVCVPHIPIHIPMYVHLCTIQYTLRTTIWYSATSYTSTCALPSIHIVYILVQA